VEAPPPPPPPPHPHSSSVRAGVRRSHLAVRLIQSAPQFCSRPEGLDRFLSPKGPGPADPPPSGPPPHAHIGV